jgi:hypothetical protein
MREPRAAKSFRAAGDRIVRQESAMPSVVSRLLTTPNVLDAPRRTAGDTDEWSSRLAALAALGQYDGVAIIVDGETAARSSYNVALDPADDATMRSAIEEARRSGATVQARTATRLSDDRVAGTATVAPLVAIDAVRGVLVALRVGRPFAATDALIASRVSELVSLELARETAARRDEAHRREAFALYELGRLALFGESLTETLQDVTVLLTTALDHDIAQIWLLGAGDVLGLTAAQPLRNLRSDQVHPSEHHAFAEALHQRRLVRIGHGALRPWVPADTRELVVVPLVDGARSLGLLLLGRAADRYEEADEELALVIGTFVARLVARAAPAERQSSEPSRAQVREPDREWEAEPQLTGS